MIELFIVSVLSFIFGVWVGNTFSNNYTKSLFKRYIENDKGGTHERDKV